MSRYLAALATAATACLCFALIELGLTARQSHLAIAQGNQDETLLAAQFSAIGKHADEVLAQVDQEVPAEKERVKNESQDLQKATTAVKDLAQRLDFALYGKPGEAGLVAALTSAANGTIDLEKSTGRDLDSAARSITETQTDLAPSLKNLALATDALATKTPPILDSISQSAGSTVTTSAQLAEAATDVHKSTANLGEMVQKVHDDFMHPSKRLWHYFMTVLGIASNVGNASKL